MPRVIEAFAQFFDWTGAPLVDGWLRFLVSGTNSTDKNTYSDSAETVLNTNPVQLDAEGRCPSIFGSGSYRAISYTNDIGTDLPAAQIQQFDPVGGTTGTGQFADWNGESLYPVGEIVTGDDGNYYRSLVANNQGADPSTDTAGNWEQFEFTHLYTRFRSYALGDHVRATDGGAYKSRVASNLSNTPQDSPTEWELVYIPLPVIVHTGGGNLTAGRSNEIQDSDTYLLPLANSVDAESWLDVEITDKYRVQTPLVQRSGADTITDVNGTDTGVLFDGGASVVVRYISDGSSDWRI